MVPPRMASVFGRFAAFLRTQGAILLPAFVYVAVFPYLPQLRSPNELCRLYQTRAIADHHTLQINEVMREQGPIGDLSCVAVERDGAGQTIARRPCPEVRGQRQFKEEHYYPSKAPLLSVVAVPIYRALEAWRRPVPEEALIFFARLACIILPSILLLIPLRRFLRAYVDPGTANAAVVTYAFGTLAFSYSELFMSHQPTAVLLFACFYALWRIGRGEWRHWGYAIAGSLAGLSVAAEYTAALGLLPLAVYGLVTAPGGRSGRIKALVLGLIGTLPPALALGWYHWAAFGHPLESGYRYLNDAAYQGWHLGGFLGIRVPDPRALVLSYFSPLRGLFILSPFLLLGVIGLLPRFWRSGARAELGVSLALLVLYTYFTSSFSYESWGWTTGPRHLTPLVPFLLLPAALVIEAARTRPAAAGVISGLLVLSILITSALTFVNYISDSLTNPFYELALPLARTGHLPQTVFSLLGVPNPWAALPVIVAITIGLASAVRAVLPPYGVFTAAASSVATVALLSGALAFVRPDDQGRQRNEETYRFMTERYVPTPGRASPPLWGSGSSIRFVRH
jgi:hypothetical protein